jgi:hypothetical protein
MDDELERLVSVYQAQALACPSQRINLLADLQRIRDPRVVPFLLTVLLDKDEADDVRMYVMKELHSGTGVVGAANRPAVAQALRGVLAENSADDLRVQAALGLGEFTDINGVVSSLGVVCNTRYASIDLRYAAFTSLARAGPTPESVELLEALATDDSLGGASRSVLASWHI